MYPNHVLWQSNAIGQDVRRLGWKRRASSPRPRGRSGRASGAARAKGRCQCWRSRAAPDLRRCEGYPRKACTGSHRPHVGGAAPGAQAARRGPWAAASAGSQGLPLTSGPAGATPAGFRFLVFFFFLVLLLP